MANRSDGSSGPSRPAKQSKRPTVDTGATLMQLPAILESMSDGFVAISRDWRYTYVNAAAARFLRRPADELVGSSVFEAFPEARGTAIEKGFRRTLEQNVATTFEAHYPPLNAWFECHCHPGPDGISVFFTDTTQRKGTEEALRRSERLARSRLREIETIYNSAHVGLCVFDRKLRYIRMNERLAEINGIPAADHIGRTIREVLPDLADMAEETAQRIFRTGEPVLNIELSGVTAAQPGVQRHWVEHWLPLKNDGGKVTGINVVVHEVTEQKRAEQALQEANERLQAQTEELQAQTEELQAQREELQMQAEELTTANEELRESEQALRQSEARYRSLAENVPSVLMRYDRELRVVYLSPKAEEITGVPTDRFIGKTNRQVGMPEDLCSLWENAIDEVFRTGRNKDLEFSFPSAEGAKAFYLKLAPEFDSDGAVTHVLGISTDITDRKRAKEALREANERLQVQSEELAAANEELQAATEELRAQEEALQKSLRETRRTAARLNLLSDTAASLLAAEEPQVVVESLCQAVMKFLDCQAFFNFLVDERAGRLRLNACAGIPKKDRKKIEWLDFGTGVCGCVARDGQRIVAEHIPDSDDERTALVKSYGIYAYACHPIIADSRVLGTLSFGTKTRETFREDELSLMKAVTDMVAIAVQRQQTAQTLRETNDYLDSLFNYANAPIIVWDPQLRITRFNHAFERLTGRMAADVLGREIDILFPQDSRAESLTHIQSAAPGRTRWEVIEIPILHVNGSVRTVLWNSANVLGPDGTTIVATIAQGQNVTERKVMEVELRRLNEQLEQRVAERTEQLTRSIDRLQDEMTRRVLAEGKLRKHSRMLEGFFQHTITPLAFLDRQFNFVRVNEAYARANAKDPKYFPGKNHFELYPHEENRAIFEQVVRTRQPYRAYARPFIYPDDPQRVMYWDWQLTPLMSEFGDVQFLVLNLADVTEQQKALQELERRARQLQHLTLELSEAEDRERKRLAEILHDDLQQLLAAAKFHLGILSNRVKDNESAREIAGQISQMLREAIDQSRSLSHELSPAVLYEGDLGETFEWLAQQVQSKHGLIIHVEAHGRIESQSDALRAFLYRTAQEMLFNVVKHAKAKEARLRLRRVRGRIWMTISDQGRGFDPKTLSRSAGFGLLSIRERVELLGGRMKIRSAADRGSTFLIAVPDPEAPVLHEARTEQPIHDGAAERKHAESSGGMPLRVLLVDDHEVMREGLAILLGEQEDMEIVGQAGNGREAVELASKLTPDVVIMDASMPVMAGDEATRQIKRLLPGTRIIGLSMFEESQMAKKMRKAGAEAYLLKTAPSEQLLTAIRGKRRHPL